MNMAVAKEGLSRLSASGSSLAAKVVRFSKPVWRALTFNLMDGIIVPRKDLTVSVEKGCVWVVCGSRFLSKIKIRGARKYAFDEGKYAGPENLASTLILAVKELKASKTGISLSLPRDWTIVRTVELPVTVKETIGDVIGYELDRLTPLSQENAYYDFRILSEGNQKLELIIVAARADLINQYREASKQVGVEVGRVTIKLSNMVALCLFMGSQADSICLETNAFGYEGGVIRDGVLAASFGGAFSDKDQGKVEAVVTSLTPVIDMFRKQGSTPSVLFYEGDSDHIALDKYIDVPVKMFDDNEIKLKLSTDIVGISQSAAGSVVEDLWSGAKGFNLLEKGFTKRVKMPVAISIVLAVLILATWVPYVVLPLQREGKRLEEINRQISIRKDEVRKVEALKKEVEALSDEVASVDRFKESSPMTLGLLKELTTILPKTVWLTRTRITDTTVDVEGYANSASEILPKLEQSPYFRKVEFASPTIRDTRLNADRFVIKMEIEGFGKEAADKPKEGGEKPRDGKKK